MKKVHFITFISTINNDYADNYVSTGQYLIICLQNNINSVKTNNSAVIDVCTFWGGCGIGLVHSKRIVSKFIIFQFFQSNRDRDRIRGDLHKCTIFPTFFIVVTFPRIRTSNTDSCGKTDGYTTVHARCYAFWGPPARFTGIVICLPNNKL